MAAKKIRRTSRRRNDVLLLLGCCVVMTGLAWGQSELSLPNKAADPAVNDKVADAINKATPNTPDSIYFVERLAEAKVVQAIPMLEEKFKQTEDVLDKAHVASALVRLGDKNDDYWDYLVKVATTAVESDEPNFTSYDSQGKTVPGPSPEFVAWVEAHHLSHESAGQESMYFIPGRLAMLSMTGDRRGIPLLRRALLSPNHMIEILAANGLAQILDKDSIPLMIEACKRAPSEVATVMAQALVYFDDTDAQSAVDTYIPKDMAKAYRQQRAREPKPFANRALE